MVLILHLVHTTHSMCASPGVHPNTFLFLFLIAIYHTLNLSLGYSCTLGDLHRWICELRHGIFEFNIWPELQLWLVFLPPVILYHMEFLPPVLLYHMEFLPPVILYHMEFTGEWHHWILPIPEAPYMAGTCRKTIIEGWVEREFNTPNSQEYSACSIASDGDAGDPNDGVASKLVGLVCGPSAVFMISPEWHDVSSSVSSRLTPDAAVASAMFLYIWHSHQQTHSYSHRNSQKHSCVEWVCAQWLPLQFSMLP